jgi:hypothetical protein
MAYKYSSERKSHIYLTLNQKLEIIYLSWKQDRPEAKPPVHISQVMNAKEKFLKAIKMLLQWKLQVKISYCWYGESFSCQTSHNIP